ncbi:hypothetical protein MKX08_008124 [Trichoderma sp. CBMAI-0020]|nr:hypothetical protein MKX08_008124 [Trichoderma sp. CBMAI-0020]
MGWPQKPSEQTRHGEIATQAQESPLAQSIGVETAALATARLAAAERCAEVLALVGSDHALGPSGSRLSAAWLARARCERVADA